MNQNRPPYPTYILWGIMSVVILGSGWIITRKISDYMYAHSSPWFGRGKNLPRCPLKVIVGPVEVHRGIPGVLEIGMNRGRVLQNLGQPIVKAMTTDEAINKGFIDPEDVQKEFYEGVFAWVEYNGDNKVCNIEFDLNAYYRKFGGQQIVVLGWEGNTILLHHELTKAQVKDLLQSRLGLTRLHVEQGEIIIIGTGTIFSFDPGGRLEKISILKWRFN